MATVVPVDDPDDPRLDDYSPPHRCRAPAAHRARRRRSGGRQRGDLHRRGHDRHPPPAHLALPDALGPGHARPSWPCCAARSIRSTSRCSSARSSCCAAVAGFDLHRGAVAVGRPQRRRCAWSDIARVDGRTIAVLEGLNDHENLGAIARSAIGAGRRRAPARPDVRRPAVPPQRPGVDGRDAPPALRPARAVARRPRRRPAGAGFRIVALTPDRRSPCPSTSVRVAGDERVAIVLGAEGPGLSDADLAAADVRGAHPAVGRASTP